MRLISILTGLLIFALTISSTATAQDQTTDSDEPVCAPPNIPTDVRPEPHSDATEVTVGMRVFDITEINDVNQTITIDLAFGMQWVDPRLADKAGCKLDASDIWFPEIMIMNSGRIFTRWAEVVTVSEGGQVDYIQRMSGTLAGYQNLQDFPFDHQEISVRTIALDWSSEKLKFIGDQQFTGISYPLNISDWSIRGVTGTVDEFFISAVNQERSAFVLTVSADRHTSYYIWKVFMPITLIVIMSWCPFWIKPTEFGTQLGLSASSVLTMVAFIFATTSMMPVLGYFTFMDAYIAICTVFVFSGLLQSLLSGYVASKGRVTTAGRIDFASRFIFPLAFFAIVYTLYSLSGVSLTTDQSLT